MKEIKYFIIACIIANAFTFFAFESIKTQPINLTIKTHLGAGFFAEFSKVMSGLIHFEEEGLQNVYVDWTDEFFPYKDEPHGNGWNLYFEPIMVDNNQKNSTEKNEVYGGGFHEIHDQICSSPWLSYDAFLPYRTFVNQKINQYIQVKKNITHKVDDFYDKHMHNSICIGVHVRYANAHSAEVPGGRHPSIEEYFAEIDAIKNAHPHRNITIYVATDSHYVINRFRQNYGAQAVYIDAYRANNTEDPGLIYENADYWLSHPAEWHQKKPGYIGGLTTLLDCLLLARCNYLIHTTSNLSNFVSFFNPHIKSVYLPRSAPYIACRHKNDSSVRNKFLNPI